jgi:hypothetical protein
VSPIGNRHGVENVVTPAACQPAIKKSATLHYGHAPFGVMTNHPSSAILILWIKVKIVQSFFDANYDIRCSLAA